MHIHKQKQAIDNTFEEAGMLDLSDKGFKAAIICMFNELEVTTSKEIKKGITIISYQINNMSKEIKIINKNQI